MTDTIKFIINSDQSYKDRESELFEMYKKHRHLTVSVRPGIDRSTEQNRLQRMWLNEAEEQGDQTAEEYRGYCKLHFGVEIMKSQSEEFADTYDRIIRPLPYEKKLELMMLPLDLPVTRLMTRKNKTLYLDRMYQHFTGLGFTLTEPKNG